MKFYRSGGGWPDQTLVNFRPITKLKISKNLYVMISNTFLEFQRNIFSEQKCIWETFWSWQLTYHWRDKVQGLSSGHSQSYFYLSFKNISCLSIKKYCCRVFCKDFHCVKDVVSVCIYPNMYIIITLNFGLQKYR